MAETIHKGYLPPPARALRSAPYSTLPGVLFRNACGGMRSYCDATYLAHLVSSGRVLVSDLVFVVAGTQLEAPSVPMSPRRGFEGVAHRILRKTARALAHSLDPKMAVASEVHLVSEKWRIRPDVIGLGSFGAIAFEVGAEDGRDIVALLDACFQYVVLIPFAAPQAGAYHCYSFRMRGAPRLPSRVAVDSPRP